MLTLKISETNSLRFYNEVKTKINKSVQKTDGTNITDDEIKSLIIGLPDKLVGINNSLIEKIIDGFNQDDYEDYLKTNKNQRN